MTQYKLFFYAVSSALMLSSATASADESGRFYGKIYGGISFLSDKDFDQTAVAAAGATGNGSYSTGWMAGAAAGYHITRNISAELAWDFRTNDNDNVTFSDGSGFSEGNYASNIFFLNGYYHFDNIGNSHFRPYLGAGLGYVQEIDMDIEAGGVETSYSRDNEFAYQLIAGTSYTLNEHWDLTADARYVRVDSLNLKNEAGAGILQGVDYDPFSIIVGTTYKF